MTLNINYTDKKLKAMLMNARKMRNFSNLSQGKQRPMGPVRRHALSTKFLVYVQIGIVTYCYIICCIFDHLYVLHYAVPHSHIDVYND